METIFSEDLERKLKIQPKLLLKVNAELKKLGISKIQDYGDVLNETYFEELVLIETFNYNKDAGLNEELTKELSELEGYNTGYLRLKDIPDGAIEWKIGETTVGYYHKERNYILCFYPFFSDNRIVFGQKNEIIPYFINKLKIFSKEIKGFEVADVSEIGKQILAERFNEVWVKRGLDLSNMIDGSNNDIDEYKKRLKNSYDNIKLHQTEKKNVEIQLGKGMEKISEVLKKLENSKAIKGVKIENHYILVEYGDIYIKRNDKDIYIGDFVAKIGTGELEIINKKPIYKVSNKEDMKNHCVERTVYHPHINREESHHICFGGARSADISKFKSDLEYDKVAYLILLFLKTYTEEDGGYEGIRPWEKVTEHKGKRYYIMNDDDGDEEELDE